jgi:hypothetical protein
MARWLAIVCRIATVVVAASTPASAGAQTITELKDRFVNAFYEHCLVRQRAAPENTQLPQEVIVKFCGCMKNRLPGFITMDDLVELTRAEEPGPNFRNRVKCSRHDVRG